MPRAKQQLPTSLQRAYARRQKQVHSKSKHSISNLVPLHGRKEGLKSLSLQTLFIPKEGNGHGLAHEMSGLELGRGPDHLTSHVLSSPLASVGPRPTAAAELTVTGRSETSVTCWRQSPRRNVSGDERKKEKQHIFRLFKKTRTTIKGFKRVRHLSLFKTDNLKGKEDSSKIIVERSHALQGPVWSKYIYIKGENTLPFSQKNQAP